MLLSELSRRDPTQTAVWPDFVVILPPAGYRCSGLLQCLKPMFVEMLVTEFAVETLDVTVLNRSPWLDQNAANSVSLRPGPECPTCEFRSVVSPNHLWIATK